MQGDFKMHHWMVLKGNSRYMQILLSFDGGFIWAC